MESKAGICPVLIVDDDNDLCQILIRMLPKVCSAHVEHTLEMAESYLSRLRPEIILLDNNLPDGHGIQHIRTMLGFHPDAKIVLMTSDTSKGLKENALEEGAVRFISKPFSAADLSRVIFSLCPELPAA